MEPTFREIAYKSPEWTKAVRLREKILREPLGNTFSSQELEEENNHFQIAGFIAENIVATAVLVPESKVMKMQRVVVAEKNRGLKIGSEMMKFCERFSSDRKFELIYCHARDSAVEFYIKNGYETMGDYFNEDGIPHVKMRKKL